MTFLTETDDINSVDACKKKFCWDWFNRKDSLNEPISIWYRKIDVPGNCFCLSCNRSITYAYDGVKVLGAFYLGHAEEIVNDERTVDLQSRRSRTPELIELCKTLAHDIQSVNSLRMSQTTLSYKLKYGLAKTIKDEQFLTLRNTKFSLNIDESTSSGCESILSILVQYFCDKEKK